jgi:dTDP-4-dehydrorhamnose 3,5-epimerase
MKVLTTPIEGLFLFEPKIYSDERGSFQETFRDFDVQDAAGDEYLQFVQENQSVSHQNVFRGFHFQIGKFAQAKLVRVIKGAVVDMVIDLRRNSATYGQMHSQLLSEENNLQMYIPVGFAHGFVSLENGTIFNYKCSQYYNKMYEGGINPSSIFK